MRKLLLITTCLAVPATAMLMLQLPTSPDVQGDDCLLCIWDRLADVRLYLFLLFCDFGGIVAAILPDRVEEYMHVVSGPLYDLFCDFGGMIDAIISGGPSDGGTGQGSASQGYY